MTGQIVNLDQWRHDHPPLVRLAHISTQMMGAAFRLQQSAWRAWWSLFVIR